MKSKILNLIKKNNNDLTIEELEIIEYGLDSVYLTITKLLVVFILSYLLGIIKETLYILFFYNIIRFFSFGMHAKKSSHCMILSISLFVIVPYIISLVSINEIIKIIFGIISFVLIIIYAPADTEKRPLINKKKRIRFKFLSIIISFILLILIIYYRKYTITSYMLVGLITASIVILPITYKIFGLPYNNYKTYKEV